VRRIRASLAVLGNQARGSSECVVELAAPFASNGGYGVYEGFLHGDAERLN
jgi:hypothetical protein